MRPDPQELVAVAVMWCLLARRADEPSRLQSSPATRADAISTALERLASAYDGRQPDLSDRAERVFDLSASRPELSSQEAGWLAAVGGSSHLRTHVETMMLAFEDRRVPLECYGYRRTLREILEATRRAADAFRREGRLRQAALVDAAHDSVGDLGLHGPGRSWPSSVDESQDTPRLGRWGRL